MRLCARTPETTLSLGTYFIQVENGGYLRQSSELVTDGPSGGTSEVTNQRSEVFIVL